MILVKAHAILDSKCDGEDMAELTQTPGANRLHIGIFGKTNSGKSSFINAFTGQEVSIVSEVKGTTTDPVSKSMEIYPLGPCVLIDTAGFDDASELGATRLEKTKKSADKCDIAVLMIAADDALDFEAEQQWMEELSKNKIPFVILINKADLGEERAVEVKQIVSERFSAIYNKRNDAKPGAFNANEPIIISAALGRGMDEVKAALARLVPEDFGLRSITEGLVNEGDSVLLVMPQDIQAPKGRLILPQVQTIRELLDKKALVSCVTTDQLLPMLDTYKIPPKLIITDSQVFSYVYEHKPEGSLLTSFSVLMAAQKGDIDYFVQSANAIAALTEQSKVCIAECCTHAPLEEDIGRVKIPRMLRAKIGEGLTIDIKSGTDFPEDPSEYDLIIQCGSCMFNRKYVMSRVEKAKEKSTPMTNYGVTIAYLSGILDKIEY